MTTSLRDQLGRIWNRRWFVVLVAVLCVAAAAGVSLTADTTYTGRAALTTATTSRSPDQDAALTQGYVQYFNEKSYQELIGNKVGLPPDVTFTARTAATSPILYIEASSIDRTEASEAAAALARAFRDEVRGQIDGTQREVVAELQVQIGEAQRRLDTTRSAEERLLILQEIFDLQSRATDVQGDTTNLLKDLQLYAGVSESRPNLVLNLALGLVGGLILGATLALALAALRNRIGTPRDVRERLGLDTLAVLDGPRGGAGTTYERELKALSNLVGLAAPKRPAVLVVAAPYGTPVTLQVAEALAHHRAQQGERVLLLQADLKRNTGDTFGSGWPGVADVLAQGRDAVLRSLAVVPGPAGLRVVPAGNAVVDPYTLVTPERWVSLTEQAAAVADLVVVHCPPLNEAPESHVICAAADATILVVEKDVTRATDAFAACQRLQRLGVRSLGAVIVRTPSGAAHGSYLAGSARPVDPAGPEAAAPHDTAEPDRAPGLDPGGFDAPTQFLDRAALDAALRNGGSRPVDAPRAPAPPRAVRPTESVVPAPGAAPVPPPAGDPDGDAPPAAGRTAVPARQGAPTSTADAGE